MKKTTAIATFSLILCAGATGASALALSGSDTLKAFTGDILTGISSGIGSPLAACPNTAGLTYAGGGSGSGEGKMSSGLQTIAPMSRFLKSGNTCTGAGTNPAASLGLVVALDGVSIVAKDSEVVGCGSLTGVAGSSATDRTLAVTGTCADGCTGSNYVFTDWKDVLAVLFAGRTHGAGPSASGVKDCNSSVRKTLAANYHKIFTNNGAGCTTGTCASVRHIFRRDDLSGTTDTFQAAIGMTGVTDFCNGSDLQNNDPITVPCTPNKTSLGAGAEDVCDKNGNLGLVLPVTQPETSTQTYNTAACEDGKFAFFPPPLSDTTCPNGSLPQAGKCLTPVQTNGQPCLAEHFQTPPIGPAIDPRVYNAILRNTNGTIVLDNNGRQMNSAWYRIHSRHVMPGGGPVCNNAVSSTLQIGCLTVASPCSLGFAGREAGTVIANTSPLPVNGLTPDVPQIRALLTDPDATNDLTTYKLARNLYLSSMKGFNAGTAEEKALTSCESTRANVDAAANHEGFITIDDTGATPVPCRDFKETAAVGGTTQGCGLAGPEHDACTDARPAHL